MCHVFRCDTPARHIANTLRDICKKIMLERHIEQNAVVQRLSRPTDLPNLEKSNGQANGQKMSFQSLYNSKWQSLSFLAWESIRIVGGILVYLACIANFNVFVVERKKVKLQHSQLQKFSGHKWKFNYSINWVLMLKFS